MKNYINPLRTSILITWFKFTQQLNQPNSIGKISINIKNTKKILMIFPDGKSNSRIAGHFLKSFDKNINETKIDFLINKSIYHSYQFNLPNHIKTYSDNQINWFRVPKKTFINSIIHEKYDAVVDLQPKFNFFSAYLTLKSRANTRIGFLSKYSYLFYNLEIDRKNTEFLEQSYLYLKKLLNL
tara:strand:- start:1628 stop:2176 length:549 start_codon:yes stop_codon:yes gene_type:complete